MVGLQWSLTSGVIAGALACACNRSESTDQPVASSHSAPSAVSAPRAPRSSPPRIALKSARIDHIQFEQVEAPVVELAKRDGKWILAAPKPEAAADPSAIDTLLSDLEGIEFVQPVSERMRDRVRVVMKRGDTTVLDAWLGYRVQGRGALVRLRGSEQVWFVFRAAPWIFFATDKDFRLEKK
ncbi:MAG: hypothetical protein R3B13_16110 [Polyangiaceae bacterium]